MVWRIETREITVEVEESLGYSENRFLSFDIALLHGNEGISRDLVETFVVHLIGHNPSINGLLAPTHR